MSAELACQEDPARPYSLRRCCQSATLTGRSAADLYGRPRDCIQCLRNGLHTAYEYDGIQSSIMNRDSRLPSIF